MPEWAPEISNPDLSNWLAQRGERWGSMEAVLQSHKDLESLRGVPESQLLKLVDTEDREAWHGQGGIWSRLGRPDNADQYDLPKIEQTKDVFDISKPFREAAFEAGVSTDAVKMIFDRVFGDMQEFQTAYNTETQRSMVEGHDVLKREWAGDYDANMSIAKKGAAAMGFDVESDEGLNTLAVIEREIGTREFLHHMHQIGQRLGSHDAGEHGSAQTSATFMSPDMAKAELDRLQADPEFTELYLSADSKGDEARERMTQLFRWANPS